MHTLSVKVDGVTPWKRPVTLVAMQFREVAVEDNVCELDAHLGGAAIRFRVKHEVLWGRHVACQANRPPWLDV